MNADLGRPRSAEGSVLISVLLIGALLATLAGLTASTAHRSAVELRSRHQVLCARFAAKAALAAGPQALDSVKELLGPGLDSVELRAIRRGPAWCVLQGTARCGEATRRIERNAPSLESCQ